MRLNIGRSKNQKYYYVQKTVYIDGKEKSLIVEKLGSHTSLLKKLNGEDPLEWAKKYVEELNRKEQEDSTAKALKAVMEEKDDDPEYFN